MPVNSELVAKLLQPIPGEAPSGKDLRYDARVDAIKEARREDPDLPRRPEDGPRKLADWPVVIKATVDLLTTETKDLQLQVWLTEALLNKDGFGGFATGLEGLAGLLSQYWETVHPLPEDDDLELRIGPLELIGAKLALPVKLTPLGATGLSFMKYALSREVPTEADGETDRQKRLQREEALTQGKPSPESVDSVLEALNKGAVRAIIAEIDQVVTSLMTVEKLSDEKFGRDAPAFNSLRNAIDEIRRFLAGLLAQKLELDPDPEVDEIAATETTASDDGGVLTAEPTSRADAAQRIGVVARWLRQQDSTSPAPYLLLRGFRWGELRVNAPELDPKLLEAPATATRAKLKTLKLDGKWSELLEQSENLMATAPGRGWLDLQRYVLTALANLGTGHDAVAAAIRSELKGLLRAVPQITRMTLMDDTPTANEETREWLEQEGLAPTPDELEAAAPETTSTEEDVEMTDGSEALVDALEDDASSAHQGGFTRTRAVRSSTPRGRDAFDLARGELAQGRPNRAIELLMADLAREQSPRGRFVRQTQIAYVMVESGLDGVAMPILQRLVETIDERTLEQWESGPVVAQPMALLCRVYDRLGVREDDRAELYLRVCRLDPIQAIALSPR